MKLHKVEDQPQGAMLPCHPLLCLISDTWIYQVVFTFGDVGCSIFPPFPEPKNPPPWKLDPAQGNVAGDKIWMCPDVDVKECPLTYASTGFSPEYIQCAWSAMGIGLETLALDSMKTNYSHSQTTVFPQHKMLKNMKNGHFAFRTMMNYVKRCIMV